jgi:hypothetical protein
MKAHPPLVGLWLVVSPLLVGGLVIALMVGKPQPPRNDVLDPYVCRPKSLHSSLATICDNSPARPSYPADVRPYSLSPVEPRADVVLVAGGQIRTGD